MIPNYDQWKTRPPEAEEPDEVNEEPYLTARREDGAALICSPHPVACPVCKRMAYFLVNSQGRTTCAECAP